ncbi:MAG: T9SS type A sorting domain-containing protein [Bacteroidetes bacterium]|nr:T9SS type A sorting domain-containing protein [Bacteroidota bacterium]
MKPIFTILLATILFLNKSNGQSITPSNFDAYCPLSTLSFNIALPNNCSNISISDPDFNVIVISNPSNIYTSSSVTTFDCSIMLADKNVSQRLRVSYHNNALNQDLVYDFYFPYVKSLLYPSSLNQIAPNYSSLNAPLCETPSFNISFTNIQYTNINTGTKYGTITNYEYSLPQGWVLGSTTSSGPSNWILAGNNVTITADKTNGTTSSSIKIRAINSCGSGLIKGSEVVIPIVRDRPQLSFSPGSGFLCSTSAQFSANNVPTWVSGYLWEISPSTAFSLSSATSNPTTLNRSANTEGTISLKISSSSCPLTFTYNNVDITGQQKLVGGTPLVNTSLMIYSGPGDENELCRNTEYYIPLTTGYGSTPSWSYVSHSGSPQPSWNGSNTDIYVYFFRSTQTSLTLNMSASNTCGTSSYDFKFNAIDCPSLISNPEYKYLVSPNPSKGLVNISLRSLSKIGDTKSIIQPKISQVILSNRQNTILFSQKFQDTKSASINLEKLLPGIYYLSIISGKTIETQQLIIK